ncbi:TRAP transporter substrate-binding protein [Acuticoccus sp. M5D2P5]|uniref:TRAP transporter substrate-binding protein n=1 Tax=Acuticoccus kalidii TaxID=2910977 RepID=UPI001F3DA672|nr:TRAP transporter substrate-binding protein [Acuticoccus kalidii]MCF3933269.1 TRAP transporter substrate-binding protein [Acuticoccus kalidii]
MLKRLLSAAALAALVGAAAPASAADFTMKLASPSQPADITVQAFRHFADLVNERSEGRIDVQVFDSAQLGDQRDYIESMRFGSIQGGEITTSVMSSVAEQFEVFNLPYLSRSMDHLREVVEGGLNEDMNEILLDEANLRILAWMIRAPRSVYGNRPIRTPADFNGLKIRVMESPAMLDAMEAFGAKPVPISASERYMALQTGVVDAAENSPTVVVSEKEYEVTDVLSLTQHFLSPNLLVVDNNWFTSLPEDLQEIVLQAGKDAQDYAFEAESKANAETLDQLKAQGMDVVEVEDVSAFVEAAKPIHDAYREKLGDLIDRFSK